MQAYEKGTPAYFATPPVNLIYAYHEALSQILKAPGSIAGRLQRQKETSARIKAAATEIGLKFVPADPANAANGMTAVRPSLAVRVAGF
jgi:alanine-glyoxylate transaminase/serine-glyoxylate transaminase/serine-pyruvate transaminase